jgi:predicted dehydrogenase/threonine dehydrogenase-like Zn-dependent dehydrogenase
MRQLVQDLRSGELQVIDSPDPVADGGDVLIRTTWSLISAGTEQAVAETASKSLLGKARDRPDLARKVVEKARREGIGAARAAVRARLDDLLTPGYSSAGVVEALGPQASGVRVGDRVACVGANAACHAERAVVPAPSCFRLPDELEDRLGAFAAVGAIAAHGVRISGLDAGSSAVVIGLGLVGQLTAQLVRAAGGRPLGIDVNSGRADLARRLGTSACTDVDELEEIVREASAGNGADSVILTAAGDAGESLELAARIARDRAVVVAVGDFPLLIPRRPFYEKELQLRLSRSYGPGRYDPEYEEHGRDYPIGYVRWTQRRLVRYFLEEVAARSVRPAELITHEFPIERAVDAYEALSDPSRLAVMLRYGSEPPERLRRITTRPAASPRAGRLRVGLLGPGTFARATLLPLLRSLDVDLVAVGGRSPTRAVGVARRTGAEFAAADAEEILSDESIDVVVIATRHDSHATLATEALERGKSVFLEKPLAIEEEGLARLEPLLAAGGRLAVDFNRSLAPETARVASHIRGQSAEPLFVNYRVNAGYLEPDHWLRDPDVGGGRLVGEACHFVDLVSCLVGSRLRTVQVAGLGEGRASLEHDSFALTLRYDDGSVGSISYLAVGSPKLPKERIEVFGGRRSAVIEDFRRVFLFPDPPRARRLRSFRQDKGHAAILQASFEFFRNGGQPPIPYDRLLETTRATFLAREALHRAALGAVTLDDRA